MHGRGARIHKLDEGVEKAFELLVEISRAREAEGDFVKNVERLGLAREANRLGVRLRIHFVRQLFQHAAEAVDVLDDVIEVGLSRERNLGRQVTAAHAFGPVAQVAHEPEPPTHAVDQQCQHGNGRKREDQRDPVGQHAAGEASASAAALPSSRANNSNSGRESLLQKKRWISPRPGQGRGGLSGVGSLLHGRCVCRRRQGQG